MSQHRLWQHRFMHGLGIGADLGELAGGVLSFVGFGQYQVQLAFSGATDCSISVEGHYRVSPPAGEKATYTEAVDGAVALLQLLGRTVVSAGVPEDGTVRITLDDGSLVEVLDSSTQYESYQLKLGHRLIVV